MIDIKRFLIGLFYLIPTIMLACLAIDELIIWNDDIELGFISLFGTLFLGLMSFTAFKQSFSKKQILSGNDIPLKTTANEDLLKKDLPKEESHYCPFCGKIIIGQWKYCYYCGKQIKK